MLHLSFKKYIFTNMANTYTQLFIHLVFAPKHRAALIDKTWKDRLHQYIIGTLNNLGHKTLAINSMPDHIHIFVGLNPDQSISDMVQAIKANSSKWINEEKLARRKFDWQKGYGAFSNSKSQVDRVVKYILNQEKHHAKKTFLKEYEAFLEKYGVSYDPKYVFHEPL